MCGIFSVIRKPGAPAVSGRVPVEAMRVVRHRGSGLGGGFARAVARRRAERDTLRAFLDSPDRVGDLVAALESEGFRFADKGHVLKPARGTLPVWSVEVETLPDAPRLAVDRVNRRFLDEESLRARVFQCARCLDVWKDVAHPDDVAESHGLDALDGDAWIAHTREPTNSPGRFPVWSHPFAAGEVAIVHNGDVSSFGANARYLRRRGYRSFTGTDSEVVAMLLNHLLQDRRLSPEDAARALVAPDPAAVAADLAGAALDGPFAVAATWATPEETFLLVVVDRAKLRPLVLAEDEHAFYAASEESQILAVSPNARTWTPEPGSFFLASSTRGLLAAARAAPRPRAPAGERGPSAASARGARFLAAGLPAGAALDVAGPTGNCVANSMDGGDVVVRGNAADDVADAMLGGRVVVHGDARDVLAQALQGGRVLVRGSAGNRVALQMREFEDEVPVLVVGGGVDDYFGEYMAGGVAVALNLAEGPHGLTLDGAPTRPTGRFVGTGMVGGALYVRGDVPEDAVGLPAADEDVANYLDALVLDGVLDASTADAARRESDPERLRALLPPAAHGLFRLMESKYAKRPRVARRRLAPSDLARVGPALDAFFQEFRVPLEERERVLASTFTVVSGRGGAADAAEEG